MSTKGERQKITAECQAAYGACSTSQQNLKKLHELSGRFYGGRTKADRAKASWLRRMEATNEHEQAKDQRIEDRIQKALQGYDGADPVVIIREITHLLGRGSNLAEEILQSMPPFQPTSLQRTKMYAD